MQLKETHDSFRTGSDDPLKRYSDIRFRRAWPAQHFSWWMISMRHRFAEDSGFDHGHELAELNRATSSRSGSTVLAENNKGLPFDLPGEAL